MKYESTHSHSLLLNYEYKYESSLRMTKPETRLSLSATPIDEGDEL